MQLLPTCYIQGSNASAKATKESQQLAVKQLKHSAQATPA
jgi:hypothetical protein